MRAGRELGDDASVRRVLGDLTRDDVAVDDTFLIDDRSRGLVARRLDPEDLHRSRRLVRKTPK